MNPWPFIVAFIMGALFAMGVLDAIDGHIPGAIIGLGGFAALAIGAELTRRGKL